VGPSHLCLTWRPLFDLGNNGIVSLASREVGTDGDLVMFDGTLDSSRCDVSVASTSRFSGDGDLAMAFDRALSSCKITNLDGALGLSGDGIRRVSVGGVAEPSNL
jgi:hypothetical protein